jgi:hypothetical protein
MLYCVRISAVFNNVTLRTNALPVQLNAKRQLQPNIKLLEGKSTDFLNIHCTCNTKSVHRYGGEGLVRCYIWFGSGQTPTVSQPPPSQLRELIGCYSKNTSICLPDWVLGTLMCSIEFDLYVH